MKSFLLLFLLVVSVGSYSQNQQINVPKGGPILLDGKIQFSEWSDSEILLVSDSVKLYFKAGNEYLYIAIRVAEGKNSIVDLYCTSDTNVFNLHASAKLGERIYKNEKWADWNWWNNSLWAANLSRVESFENRTFINENVREFQVHKDFFHASHTKMYIEVTYLTGSMVTSLVSYPSKGINSKTGHWLNLEWE